MAVSRCGLSTRTCWGVALVFTQLAIAPPTLTAQAAFRVTPSVRTMQVYDTNLFSTATDLQGDFITRLTPAVETEYATPRWTLSGRQAVDIERFADHSELSSLTAGQHALGLFVYRIRPRLAFTAGADFSRSQNAADLSSGTGLSFTRATAQRIGARTSLVRQVTPGTSGRAEYTLILDRFAGNPDIRTQSATLGADRRVSSRASVRGEYRAREFSFGAAPLFSHAVSVGWTHAFAGRASFSIDGGPNVTSGSPAFEGALTVRNQSKAMDVAVTYARTQTTVFGVGGLVTAQSVAATTAWRMRRSLVVNIVPAFYRSEQGQLQADVYRCSIGAVRKIARSLSLGITYDGGVQRGTLYAASGSEAVARHQLLVSLVAAPTPEGR